MQIACLIFICADNSTKNNKSLNVWFILSFGSDVFG